MAVRMTPITLRVAELRKAKGLSQNQLAKLAGVRQATLSAIESGSTRRVDFDVMESIADALGVDPALLIIRTEGKRRGKK
jgi:transcriptional regulator with XRE-family HTH domain